MCITQKYNNARNRRRVGQILDKVTCAIRRQDSNPSINKGSYIARSDIYPLTGCRVSLSFRFRVALCFVYDLAFLAGGPFRFRVPSLKFRKWTVLVATGDARLSLTFSQRFFLSGFDF